MMMMSVCATMFSTRAISCFPANLLVSPLTQWAISDDLGLVRTSQENEPGGLGCLSICLWWWSEGNTESIHNKNVWTKSSAIIFSDPLSWQSSPTPHIFSGDNQLYISANLFQLQELIGASQSCISDVQAWMHNKKLQPNPSKTEHSHHFSKHNQKSLSLPFSVDLNGTSIHLSSTVRKLGVTLDQNNLFSAACLPYLSNLLSWIA